MLLYFVHVRFGLFMLFKPTLIVFKNRAVKRVDRVAWQMFTLITQKVCRRIGPGHILLNNLSLYNIILQYISY